MTIAPTSELAPRKPLRLWPGVIAVALQWLFWFVVPLVVPGALGVLVGLAATLVIVVWWLFFSRARWSERVGAIVLMVVAVVVTKLVVHESIANGMMGLMLPVFAVPFLSLALVASAAAGRRLSSGPRRATMAAAILLACGGFTLVRTGGITGEADADLHWRWTQSPEERLLAQAPAEKSAAPATAPSAAATPDPTPDPAAIATPAVWPGFRGPNRDGVVRGVRIDTDWSKAPPVAMWRRPIGPGWSSFAVAGDRLFTQEQRGGDEIVAAYHLTTGAPVWRHRDAARFWESNAGAGPRGTPTVRNGRVYTLGATGIVNALDPGNGAVVWSRNAQTDTGATRPDWGFAGSPLLVGDLVIVAASGPLAGYDAATGTPRWVRQTGGGGYSSPHLATIGGVAQIVLLSGGGATGVAPADGAVLWTHTWEPGASIVQPGLTGNGDILLSGSDMMGAIGLRRIAVAHGSAGWTVEERWTSRGLKPYFNDFVVHKGHAFGFDGSILACIDLADGQRKWKGGRYGAGQLVVLSDQDLLLVLSEEGEMALVKATPDQFTEIARVPAIEGKTWNHPVLVGNVVLIRNGEEMAAFRLAPAGR